jgi:hypothetical protein
MMHNDGKLGWTMKHFSLRNDALCFALAAWVLSSLTAASAAPYQCGRFTQPERQVQKTQACDDTAGYGLLTADIMARPELAALFQGRTEAEVNANEALKDKALEAKFRLTSNMNAATFTFPTGVKRTVFRGSYIAPQFTPESVLIQQPGEGDRNRACVSNLVAEQGLNKIVNYDELDWHSAHTMTREERGQLLSLNPAASYWEFTPAHGRTFQYKFSKGQGATPQEKKRDVMGMVASIIREIEGDPSKPGSVYIHCYGGHHRTGAVWGVLQKCVGKMPVQDIIDEYKCHIGYESPASPGGYHADNEALIREFPCEEFFPSQR